MQVTETLNEGLKREIKIVVPASDMEAKLVERLTDAKSKVRLNGFRPGKVPIQHLRKLYGKTFMAEVVNSLLTDSTREILADRGERAAMQPDVTMTEDEDEAEKVLAGKADFSFSIAYEIVPEIELKDISAIKVTRPVVEIPDSEIDEQVSRIAESARPFEPKKGKAENGDRITMDFIGKIDGEAFEGGAGTDSNLVIGSNQFIPGFEDQLIGVVAGDEKAVKITFPDDYNAAHLAGREAVFDVTVKEVSKPGKLELNDELAKSLGIESMERLREIVRGQIESQYGALTRQKVKRQILDALDKIYEFEAPSNLVQAEFDNIWRRMEEDLAKSNRSFEDEDTTEEEAREEYRKLAERRVRLGLVLSEIGEKANVQVTEDEMQRALMETARQYPGQEREVFEHYTKNPDALAAFRAPLFEEKVIDHLMSEISVTDKSVTRDELMAEDEDEKAADKKPTTKKKASAAKNSEEPKAGARKKQDAGKGPAEKKSAKKKASSEE